MTLGLSVKSPAVDFAPPASYPVGTSPSVIVVGDFNGDGKPDLAVANLGSNNVSVLINAGNGTFQAAVTSPAGTAPQAMVAGDFNGDSKLDLVAHQSRQPAERRSAERFFFCPATMTVRFKLRYRFRPINFP